MSYVDDNLMPNEKVMYKARVTIAIFISSIVLFLIAIAMMFIPGLLSSGQDTTTTATAQAVCLCPAILVLLLSIIVGLQELVLILTTEFAVTNQRIIAKRGFIRRHTLEILLLKIESVAVNQNVVGRILNFGTVIITGTGGTKESFQAIIDPIGVRKYIDQVIQSYSSQSSLPTHNP